MGRLHHPNKASQGNSPEKADQLPGSSSGSEVRKTNVMVATTREPGPLRGAEEPEERPEELVDCSTTRKLARAFPPCTSFICECPSSLVLSHFNPSLFSPPTPPGTPHHYNYTQGPPQEPGCMARQVPADACQLEWKTHEAVGGISSLPRPQRSNTLRG